MRKFAFTLTTSFSPQTHTRTHTQMHTWSKHGTPQPPHTPSLSSQPLHTPHSRLSHLYLTPLHDLSHLSYLSIPSTVSPSPSLHTLPPSSLSSTYLTQHSTHSLLSLPTTAPPPHTPYLSLSHSSRHTLSLLPPPFLSSPHYHQSPRHICNFYMEYCIYYGVGPEMEGRRSKSEGQWSGGRGEGEWVSA